MFGVNLIDPYNGMTVDWLGGASVNLIVSIVTRIIIGIGWYRMFDKADKNGLFAFVPLLGEYTAFRLVWDDFGMSALFATTTFVSFVYNIGVDNVLYAICTWIAFILWWFMCLVMANVCYKTSLLWGFVTAIVPWAGTLIFGFSPALQYYGPWSTNPEDYDKKGRLKTTKKKKIKKWPH